MGVINLYSGDLSTDLCVSFDHDGDWVSQLWLVPEPARNIWRWIYGNIWHKYHVQGGKTISPRWQVAQLPHRNCCQVSHRCSLHDPDCLLHDGRIELERLSHSNGFTFAMNIFGPIWSSHRMEITCFLWLYNLENHHERHTNRPCWFCLYDEIIHNSRYCDWCSRDNIRYRGCTCRSLEGELFWL